jgi:hypothetical protein
MAAHALLYDADDTLPDIVDGWRGYMEALDGQRAELAASGETGMLAFGLDRIRELRRQLGDLERAVEADIAGLMDAKTETIDGLGTLERRRGTDRKAWQSEELLHRIIRDAVDPDGSGELPSPGALLAAVQMAITDCVPITGSLGWRVTALKARGIDPDEWATCTPGRVSVQIHKSDAA